MSGYAITTGGHPDDGVLLALIDGAVVSPADAKSHAESCDVCTNRISQLRRATDLLRTSLPPVTMPPVVAARIAGPRRRSFTYPVLAAASVLLIASVATATPLRDWIVRQFSPAPTVTPPAAEPASSPAPAKASGIIASFAPTDTLLVIDIATRQRAGTLELTAASGDRISAQAVSGATAEELVVLPGQLRIVNTMTSTADYRVAIPATVRTVSVRVAGSPAVVIQYAAGFSRRIPLR